MRRTRLFEAALPLFMFLLLGCAPWHSVPPAPREPTYVPTASPSGVKAEGIYHTVSRSETLWRIAKTYAADLQSIAEINNIRDARDIKVGQRIFIPGATATKTVLGEGRGDTPCGPMSFTTREFIWPVQGRVISTFGIHDGLRYEGIEIAAPLGTPVKASGNGQVIYEGNLRGYGNLVILKHKNAYNTVYAYNQANLVSAGRKVNKGETIATVGNSGPASEPCLYFQVRERNQARNPLFFLP